MADTRKLVVLFDGTWNTPDQKEGKLEAFTNVRKMSAAIACLDGQQRQHYEEGVGTGFQERLAGGIFGKGIKACLLNGYSFLQERYADNDYNNGNNSVFVFGFSRGAYTARLLCHLIDWSGIPKSSRDCETGVAMFLNGDRMSMMKRSGRFFDIPVEMIGVWDTVKAAPIRDYRDTTLPKSVVSGYHAMAIDEKRSLFSVLRWRKDAKRVNEMWFAGVHSDVGGGYARSGLSDITLAWMIDKAMAHGLKFKIRELDKILPDPLAQTHDSYKGFKILGKRPRKVMPRDLVHESVRKKIAAGYNPDAARWPAHPCYSA